MDVKQFILNNEEVLNMFTRQLREEIYLDTTLIKLNKIKLKYLAIRDKLPITKHEIEVARKFLLRN